MLVLTHGLLVRPRSTARFARRPAPTITEGFEVLVQLVIAAITTAPSPRAKSLPLIEQGTSGGASTATATPSPPPPSLTQRE